MGKGVIMGVIMGTGDKHLSTFERLYVNEQFCTDNGQLSSVK